MKAHDRHDDASLQYAAAHAMHYETKNLSAALELYGGVLTHHPNAREAGYARVQIRNIVDAVVPKPLILDALVKLTIPRLPPGPGALPAGSPHVELPELVSADASG